jgi:sugar/nucleoside kinase (ribokinase family)
MNSGLFVGLVTVDLIYLAESPPSHNQKIVATDYAIAAGGPATNAAVTFSYLGNSATILGVVGSNPMTQLIRTDLATHQVAIADLDPDNNTPPPISSIIVTQATGERGVISINAVKTQSPNTAIPADILANIGVVLIDGHQMVVGERIAQLAKGQGIPVVIDGGSWKPGFEKILPYTEYAIGAANFFPPHCRTQAEVFAYLQTFAIPHIAITQGEQPIQYWSQGRLGTVDVPKIQAVDTLGAGDIFHGAFCHHILQCSFPDALAQAARVAAKSCQFFGTRRWMEGC